MSLRNSWKSWQGAPDKIIQVSWKDGWSDCMIVVRVPRSHWFLVELGCLNVYRSSRTLCLQVQRSSLLTSLMNWKKHVKRALVQGLCARFPTPGRPRPPNIRRPFSAHLRKNTRYPPCKFNCSAWILTRGFRCRNPVRACATTCLSAFTLLAAPARLKSLCWQHTLSSLIRKEEEIWDRRTTRKIDPGDEKVKWSAKPESSELMRGPRRTRIPRKTIVIFKFMRQNEAV